MHHNGNCSVAFKGRACYAVHQGCSTLVRPLRLSRKADRQEQQRRVAYDLLAPTTARIPANREAGEEDPRLASFNRQSLTHTGSKARQASSSTGSHWHTPSDHRLQLLNGSEESLLFKVYHLPDYGLDQQVSSAAQENCEPNTRLQYSTYRPSSLTHFPKLSNPRTRM